ncbi:MAG: penicillin-binding protein 2 [Methylophilaceae bacterium]
MQNEIKDQLHEHYYFRRRLILAGLFVFAMFVLLAIRFYYLQVLQYSRYQTMAENNRISLVPIVPNRGLIFDKNGVVLANNLFTYTLEITPTVEKKQVEATISALNKFIAISDSDRKQYYKLRGASRHFESIPIRTHLTEAEAAIFAVNHYRLAGVEIKSRLYRQYPLGSLTAHTVGYIGRINDKDLESIEAADNTSNYKGSDHIGKSGIEQSYEAQLHGITGFQQIEVDKDGRAVRVISSTAPIPGKNITLSIDSKLQAIAVTAFGDKRGALVAIDPKTGEILTYVSQPSYDPNLFIDGIDVDNWKILNESLDKPLYNRPIQGVYPPGSTFKPFVALAGLEHGLRAPPFAIHDSGYFTLENSVHRYRDWKPSGHGIVDMQRAITVSCDTFFYGLAMELGIDKLSDFVRHFSFGKKTGIDIQGENSGLLPTPAWKMKRYKRAWYQGDTVITGIGQGYTLVTPLQLAHATATLANRGVAIQPHLATKVQNIMSGKVEILPQAVHDTITLSQENLEIVKTGMIAVTQPGGTASNVGAHAEYSIAAKTGTAQVIGIQQNAKYNASSIDERHRDHALFIAYAPADDPKIALAIIIENGGHGGSAAGPIARKVMDYYLLGKVPEAQPAKQVVNKVTKPINHEADQTISTQPVTEEELND